MRFFLGRSAVAAVLVAGAAGCTSLLGDFSEGPAGDGGGGSLGSDGSSGGTGGDGASGGVDGAMASADGGDATVSAGDGGLDGPGEAEAAGPLQQLHCTSWDHPSPTLVMQVLPFDSGGGGGGNSGPFNQLAVEHIPGMNAARLVVATSSPTGSNVSVITVNENGGGGAPSTVALANRGLLAELKTSTNVTFLLQNYMASEYDYYSIADTDPGTTSASVVGPAPALTSPPNLTSGSGGGGNFQMQFVPLPAGGYYTLASYPSGTNYDVAGYLPGPRAWGIVEGPGAAQQLGPLLLDGTNVYAFLPPAGMGNMGPATVDMYTFSTAAATAPAKRSVLPTGSTALAGTAAVAPATGGYALAFFEIGNGQQALLRLGVVGQAQMSSFLIDDLGPLQFDVQSDAGFFDTTPFAGHNGNGARWLSNGDLGVMGTGGTGNGGAYTGLNFYVATPAAQWLIETAGTGKNVLPGQTVLASAFDLAQAIGQIVLKFDVAWVQQETSGAYSLYFNVLDCQL
jgi:hypothetical protein